MSQVLVTGANGQLGREIKKLRNLFSQVYSFTDINELDLTDIEAIENHLNSLPVAYIINCAGIYQCGRSRIRSRGSHGAEPGHRQEPGRSSGEIS